MRRDLIQLLFIVAVLQVNLGQLVPPLVPLLYHICSRKECCGWFLYGCHIFVVSCHQTSSIKNWRKHKHLSIMPVAKPHFCCFFICHRTSDRRHVAAVFVGRYGFSDSLWHEVCWFIRSEWLWCLNDRDLLRCDRELVEFQKSAAEVIRQKPLSTAGGMKRLLGRACTRSMSLTVFWQRATAGFFVVTKCLILTVRVHHCVQNYNYKRQQ